MAPRTLNEIEASRPEVDRAKLDGTTEEDIRRHMIEDGQDPDEEISEGQKNLETKAARLKKIREAARRFDTLPVLDAREPDEIIGYDENGLPK